MAYKLHISKSVAKGIGRISEYIGANWGVRASDKFFSKFENKARQILQQPGVGRPSKKKAEFRRVTVARYNIVYYRINGSAIIIESIYDSRADPQKNPHD